jgi:hypothetical protein
LLRNRERTTALSRNHCTPTDEPRQLSAPTSGPVIPLEHAPPDVSPALAEPDPAQARALIDSPPRNEVLPAEQQIVFDLTLKSILHHLRAAWERLEADPTWIDDELARIEGRLQPQPGPGATTPAQPKAPQSAPKKRGRPRKDDPLELRIYADAENGLAWKDIAEKYHITVVDVERIVAKYRQREKRADRKRSRNR